MSGDIVLVTGGAGFIGSAVVRYLIRVTDARVVNVDQLTYAADLANVAEVQGHERYRFERCDIRRTVEVERILSRHRPTAIMHLAAETHVDRSIDDPMIFVDTNVAGTATLLEAARRYGRTLPPQERGRFRFHHVSTDEVFGSVASGAFDESSSYRPNSPYAASKAAADHLVRAWHTTYGLPVVISNFSNNYGPYQYPEKFIPLMILNAQRGGHCRFTATARMCASGFTSTITPTHSGRFCAAAGLARAIMSAAAARPATLRWRKRFAI
jgi:dTDP-glucose 4,6-dehydratase